VTPTERVPLTAERIEAREFTYCVATYGPPYTSHAFVVGTPSRPEARVRAEKFASRQWGRPNEVRLYPRTYVRNARGLFALGLHD